MQTQNKPSRRPGIRTRHRNECRSTTGGKCNCQPSFEAWIWSVRDQRKIRRTFANYAEARSWRADAAGAVRRGEMQATRHQTFRDAAVSWLAGAKDGSIQNRSGDRYKPSAIRCYEQNLNLRLLPKFGGYKLTDIRRSDLQKYAQALTAEGLTPSSVKNTFMPLRAIFGHALVHDELTVNPTSGLRLPAVRGKRDRVASPDEAARLIAAVPERDRAVWAVAFYAGLRLGELRALEWDSVDLPNGVIHVVRSWDHAEGAPIAPKSRAGMRDVPIPAVLRDFLTPHKLKAGRHSGFVFPGKRGQPFGHWSLQRSADKAWKAAGLNRVTLHEARHTFASLMIAAGVNAKALSEFMGHSSIQVTFDKYGHLMPGSGAEAAELLDAYLVREATKAAAS